LGGVVVTRRRQKMGTPTRPKPAHVELDPVSGKYIITRRLPGTEPQQFDTLQEALEAASRVKT
jgi:hypothetical protein